LLAGFYSTAKRYAVGITAAVTLLGAAGNAQTSDDALPLSVFRKNVGVVSHTSSKNIVHLAGSSTALPVAGDFDADGRMDTGLFDPVNRLWTVRKSSDGSTLAASFAGDARKIGVKAEPVPADFDGDGRTDMAIWCAGAWQIIPSSKAGAAETTIFGNKGDIPVPADFDGDTKADLAVFRPSDNRWYIRSSETGLVTVADLGTAGDLLVPADYTGDGKADVSVYRSGVWILLNSETGVAETFEFGFEDGLPAAGDFNRDGETDFAVYRKGTWYVYDGSRLVSYKFGDDEDVPLSMVPVRASTAGQ
jgi:hypothetical protein